MNSRYTIYCIMLLQALNFGNIAAHELHKTLVTDSPVATLQPAQLQSAKPHKKNSRNRRKNKNTPSRGSGATFVKVVVGIASAVTGIMVGVGSVFALMPFFV